jgi:diguanylate cyclase
METPSPTIAQISAEAEWQSISESLPPDCRQAVSQAISEQVQNLATHFYAYMLGHPHAKVFLDHDTVHSRLHGSMVRWLAEIFRYPQQEMSAVVAHQRLIGEVHARIHVPVYLVARGARLIKKDIGELLSMCMAGNPLLQQSISCCNQTIDLALELMSESYEKYSQRGAREDESYRLHSVGQNIAVERERQRAVLLEWGQEILFTMHRTAGAATLPSLGKSEFGLWFSHKASAIFEGDPDIEQIEVIVQRIDSTILPMLRVPSMELKPRDELIQELQSALADVKFHMNQLFDRHQEAENGRDTLTRLLNRKFLPAVMGREIKIAQMRHTGFALLLLDLDHFKNVNDAHGHDAGDQVLQQVAGLLMASVRNGDFVFRYGGEEILLMLVDVDCAAAQRLAEQIRQKIEGTPIAIGSGKQVTISASIGGAMYGGHPDHQFLIKQADEAMYSAKQQGRNRVVFAA